MRSIRLIWLCLLIAVFFPGHADAEVRIAFKGHGGGRVHAGQLLFPHAYVHIHGVADDETRIDEGFGFTAANPGPWLLMAPGSGVIVPPDERYLSQSQTYFETLISDEELSAIRARIQSWGREDGGRYRLRSRNCITFVAEIARVLGLRVPSEDTLSPQEFLTNLAALNVEHAQRSGASGDVP